MGFAVDPSVRDNFGPVVVPPDHFMGLGDNRDNSWDSRFWGPVPRRCLKGKPLVTFFSYRFPTPAGVDESEVDGTKVPLREILTHPFNIRLNRIGRLIS
jgi:signal peptidase I